MVLTVRLDKMLESRLTQEARRLGVTKSQFVKEALERSLGDSDPYALLLKVRSGARSGRHNLSQRTGARFKAKLLAQRSH